MRLHTVLRQNDLLLAWFRFAHRVMNGQKDVHLFDDDLADAILKVITETEELDVLFAGYYDLENRVNAKESVEERRAEIEVIFQEVLRWNPVEKVADKRAKKVLRTAIYELMVSYQLSGEDIATFAEVLSERFGIRALLSVSNFAQGIHTYDEKAVFGYEYHRGGDHKGTLSTSSIVFRLAVATLVSEEEFEALLGNEE